jgi:putative RNA 2'-phosphotransferase
MKNTLTSTSKFLSLVLRHQPEKIGLTLDAEGWAQLEDLIVCAANHGTVLSHELIFEVVEKSDKQRFALDTSKNRIRANQGHSVEVDLQLPVVTPPPILFHGTARRFVESILLEGLQPRSRQHVHLSATPDTAISVGTRHGKPHVFAVDAFAMVQDGFLFFQSANGVWLTAQVPPKYLRDHA